MRLASAAAIVCTLVAAVVALVSLNGEVQQRYIQPIKEQLAHGPWSVTQHKKWCAEHAPRLNVTDIQEVFRYVKWHHPLFGVAFPLEQKPILNGTESLEELAYLADAVTVITYEQLGFEAAQRENFTSFVLSTDPGGYPTNVGNFAYIALHHSDDRVRRYFLDSINLWREIM